MVTIGVLGISEIGWRIWGIVVTCNGAESILGAVEYNISAVDDFSWDARVSNAGIFAILAVAGLGVSATAGRLSGIVATCDGTA